MWLHIKWFNSKSTRSVLNLWCRINCYWYRCILIYLCSKHCASMLEQSDWNPYKKEVDISDFTGKMIGQLSLITFFHVLRLPDVAGQEIRMRRTLFVPLWPRIQNFKSPFLTMWITTAHWTMLCGCRFQLQYTNYLVLYCYTNLFIDDNARNFENGILSLIKKTFGYFTVRWNTCFNPLLIYQSVEYNPIRKLNVWR